MRFVNFLNSFNLLNLWNQILKIKRNECLLKKWKMKTIGRPRIDRSSKISNAIVSLHCHMLRLKTRLTPSFVFRSTPAPNFFLVTYVHFLRSQFCVQLVRKEDGGRRKAHRGFHSRCTEKYFLIHGQQWRKENHSPGQGLALKNSPEGKAQIVEIR